jgi:RNA polymerase primary sigma factor
VEIGRAPLISIEEEIELAQLIKKGGPEGERAKEKLGTSNLRFVVSVAKQYQHQGLSLTDLIDEGNIGLIKAAQKFDETRGFKFISYAVWWVRQSILQAIAEQSRIVRLPLNQVGSLSKINQEINRFEQKPPAQASLEEILRRHGGGDRQNQPEHDGRRASCECGRTLSGRQRRNTMLGRDGRQRDERARDKEVDHESMAKS